MRPLVVSELLVVGFSLQKAAFFTLALLLMQSLPCSAEQQPRANEGEPINARASKLAAGNYRYEILTKVAHRLLGDEPQSYLGFRPQFRISSARTPNAFAIPPQSIEVSVGLLQLAENEEELAFALAHEISHLIKVNKRASKDLPASTSSNQIPKIMAFSGHGKQEIQADLMAIVLMKEAGLPPTASIRVLNKLINFGASRGATLGSLFPGLQLRHDMLESVVTKQN